MTKIGRPTKGTSHPGLDPTSRGGACRGRPDTDPGDECDCPDCRRRP